MGNSGQGYNGDGDVAIGTCVIGSFHNILFNHDS